MAGKAHDFSQDSINQLAIIVADVEDDGQWGWVDGMGDWTISIPELKEGEKSFQNHYQAVVDKHNIGKKDFDIILEKVENVDKAYEKDFSSILFKLEGMNSKIATIASIITPSVMSTTSKNFQGIVDKTNATYDTVLKFSALLEEYNIVRPEGMTEQEFRQYLTKLSGQETILVIKGWDDSSIEEYFVYLNKKMVGVSSEKALETANDIYNKVNVVGTEVFLTMWKAWDTRGDEVRAEKKINVFLNTIEVPRSLSNPENNPEEIKKLLERFDKKLAPDNELWSLLATEVQTAFQKPRFLSDGGILGVRVNNMRYIISSQQAQYIRGTSKVGTDEDKLAAYLKNGEAEYTVGESARLHQKKAKQWPDGYGTGNFKVTLGFYTEFILNSEGKFQNELDPEVVGSNENGIVNGASFNYAARNDYESDHPKSPDSDHGRLDVIIGNIDPKWRTDMLDNSNGGYKAPTKDEYEDPNGEYVSNGKSSRDNAKNLATLFEDKINGED
ncbi:DUF3114 domain-containing protein [Listeria booriae]|uniref:DUF3114 domain-containing protein n=1 Tax=Listeria booriae TaxID=1552123 RepID=A0A842G0T2_9LIST|nr:DUF3114 domain-containing protein [Listeria booriae]MBC2292914.1 DUF3114 domain-containing protein [Listeria booriae]